jgi:hypothetical protein
MDHVRLYCALLYVAFTTLLFSKLASEICRLRNDFTLHFQQLQVRYINKCIGVNIFSRLILASREKVEKEKDFFTK